MNIPARPSLFQGLASLLALALFWFAVAIAPTALLTGCANLPTDSIGAPQPAPTNSCDLVNVVSEFAEKFPATEEEYLERCEPGIQEKLLEYPEEERDQIHELLISEASTAYLFQSLLYHITTSVVDHTTINQPCNP